MVAKRVLSDEEAEEVMRKRVQQVMEEEERMYEDPGVTLLFHFDNYDEAYKVLERIQAAGGISKSCEGHFYDEAEHVGYVVVDPMEDLVIDMSVHEEEWGALSSMASFPIDEELHPTVYSLLPLNMTAGEQCRSVAAEEGVDDDD